MNVYIDKIQLKITRKNFFTNIYDSNMSVDRKCGEMKKLN